MKNNLQQPWNMYIDRAWFKHQSSNFQKVSSLVCSYRNFKLLLIYSSTDLFYPLLFVYMLNFPSFLLIKRKRRRRATCVLASNNPTTDINIVLHSNTSAAISNRYCVTSPLSNFNFSFVHCNENDMFMPFLIHLYFTLVNHYC